MKKEVTDIQALHVDLDAEDRDLTGMFPARRQKLYLGGKLKWHTTMLHIRKNNISRATR